MPGTGMCAPMRINHEREQQEDKPATEVADFAALGQLIRG